MEQKILFNIGLILIFATIIVFILSIITGSPAITGVLAYIGKIKAEINAFDQNLIIIPDYKLREVGLISTYKFFFKFE